MWWLSQLSNKADKSVTGKSITGKSMIGNLVKSRGGLPMGFVLLNAGKAGMTQRQSY
jgi:hypothetical protein